MLDLLQYLLLTPHAQLCVTGMVISMYALHVERSKHNNPKYRAWCDFNDNMSCSKVLTSEYSKGFGMTKYLFGEEHFLNLPNCLVGIFFFLFQLMIGYLNPSWAPALLFYLSAFGSLGSLYLAYILFFVLHDFCFVCICTWVCNFGLLYVNYGG